MAGLEIRELYRDASRRLYQLSDVELQTWRDNHRGNYRGHCVASVRPVAVVVKGPDGISAFGIDGRPLSLDELRRDCDGLDAALDARATPDAGVADVD